MKRNCLDNWPFYLLLGMFLAAARTVACDTMKIAKLEAQVAACEAKSGHEEGL